MPSPGISATRYRPMLRVASLAQAGRREEGVTVYPMGFARASSFAESGRLENGRRPNRTRIRPSFRQGRSRHGRHDAADLAPRRGPRPLLPPAPFLVAPALAQPAAADSPAERPRLHFAWDEPAPDGTPAANAPARDTGLRPDAEAVAIRGDRIVFVGSGARCAGATADRRRA